MAYYLKSHTIALTYDQGDVTDRIQYSPYGILTHREGEIDTPFLKYEHTACRFSCFDSQYELIVKIVVAL